MNSIFNVMGHASPAGGTPTAKALEQALTYFTRGSGKDLPGTKWILLATDGGPNCNLNLTCGASTCTQNIDCNCGNDCDMTVNCCDSGYGYICLDQLSVLSQIDQLAQAGIKTFIVGLPSTDGYIQTLNMMAAAGRVPNQSSSAGQSYYAVSAYNTMQDLKKAFSSISGQVVKRCDMALDDARQIPDLVNVLIDCHVVARVPAGTPDTGGVDASGGTATGGVVASGGHTAQSGAASGGSATGGAATGGAPATGGASSCTWDGAPQSSDGELTCYWFSQGTSDQFKECPSMYKTYCGYCGSETGKRDTSSQFPCAIGEIQNTVLHMATPHFAAFTQVSFESGKYCGMCVDVTYQGKTITATVIDACGSCASNGHIDLSLSAAEALGMTEWNGNPKSGVQWKAVECPVTDDIYVMYNGGYRGQAYFQNVAFPVASATVGGQNATINTGFWSFQGEVGGQTVTLTDTQGHTIQGVMPTSETGGSLGVQFPLTCQ